MWFAVGAVLLAVGIIGGLTIFIAGIVSATNRAPSGSDVFEDKTGTVQLNAGETRTIYMKDADSGYDCDVQGDGDQRKPDLTKYDTDITVNGWRALFKITAPDAGRYEVSCTGGGPEAEFGAGDNISGGTIGAPILLGGLVGGIFALAGIVTIIVTGVRRGSARNKLAAQQYRAAQ